MAIIKVQTSRALNRFNTQLAANQRRVLTQNTVEKYYKTQCEHYTVDIVLPMQTLSHWHKDKKNKNAGISSTSCLNDQERKKKKFTHAHTHTASECRQRQQLHRLLGEEVLQLKATMQSQLRAQRREPHSRVPGVHRQHAHKLQHASAPLRAWMWWHVCA